MPSERGTGKYQTDLDEARQRDMTSGNKDKWSQVKLISCIKRNGREISQLCVPASQPPYSTVQVAGPHPVLAATATNISFSLGAVPFALLFLWAIEEKIILKAKGKKLSRVCLSFTLTDSAPKTDKTPT